MESPKDIIIGEVYFTKAGNGQVLKGVITSDCKASKDLFYFGGIRRHFKDIWATQEDAETKKGLHY